MLNQLLFFFWLLKHPFFLFQFSFATYRTPCHSISHHSHFPPNPYLGEQRISLGVASILSMCLCPHTFLTCHQKILNDRFYLGVLRFVVKHIHSSLVLNSIFNNSICCRLLLLFARPHNIWIYVLYKHIYLLINNTQTKKAAIQIKTYLKSQSFT